MTDGLTRRRFLTGAAAAGLAATGLYELVDRLAAAPKRGLAAIGHRREQHLLVGEQVITDEGIEVIVPSLHHRVVTAKLRVEEGRGSLLAAKRELEAALAALDTGARAGPERPRRHGGVGPALLPPLRPRPGT